MADNDAVHGVSNAGILCLKGFNTPAQRQSDAVITAKRRPGFVEPCFPALLRATQSSIGKRQNRSGSILLPIIEVFPTQSRRPSPVRAGILRRAGSRNHNSKNPRDYAAGLAQESVRDSTNINLKANSN